MCVSAFRDLAVVFPVWYSCIEANIAVLGVGLEGRLAPGVEGGRRGSSRRHSCKKRVSERERASERYRSLYLYQRCAILRLFSPYGTAVLRLTQHISYPEKWVWRGDWRPELKEGVGVAPGATPARPLISDPSTLSPYALWGCLAYTRLPSPSLGPLENVSHFHSFRAPTSFVFVSAFLRALT